MNTYTFVIPEANCRGRKELAKIHEQHFRNHNPMYGNYREKIDGKFYFKTVVYLTLDSEEAIYFSLILGRPVAIDRGISYQIKFEQYYTSFKS